MTEQHKVIIIDDDKLSTHNWKILFHFVGEKVFSLNAAQLEEFISQALDQTPVLAIMIGEIGKSELNTAELIRQIHQVLPKMPILLQRDPAFIRDKVDESSQPWIIQLPDKPDYQNLLRLLDYARQLNGLKPLQTKS